MMAAPIHHAKKSIVLWESFVAAGKASPAAASEDVVRFAGLTAACGAWSGTRDFVVGQQVLELAGAGRLMLLYRYWPGDAESLRCVVFTVVGEGDCG
jgi:hypothetical protein